MTASAAHVALVTGVSRRIGIGAAIVEALAAGRFDIFTSYYRPFDQATYALDSRDDPAGILADLRTRGVRAEGLEVDLGDPSAAGWLFDAAENALGPVDVLINNAAFDSPADVYQLSADLLDRHYAVNMRGTALLCAEFVKRHDGSPGGRIVNLTSGQGLGPMPDSLPYAMTKGAIEALTISLVPTCGIKGITVNAVDPGATDSGWMNDDLRRELTSRSPFGRVGMPQDAAHLIAFLASPEAGWITGQILRSRGGA